jgi:hypothetical protein
MKSPAILSIICSMCFSFSTLGQDLKSGPDKGKDVPSLEVFDVTGLNKGKELDYAAQRKEKPTIYLFIRADKWDRPMARFLKKVEEGLIKDEVEGIVVAVWLTDNVEKTKEYLSPVQQSLQFQITALACFPGAKAGPKAWNINEDAHLTAVVARQGKVAATFAFQSLNETNAPAVCEALQKAGKGP